MRHGSHIAKFCTVFLLFLTACSTNPATGESQFTALMSPQQEVEVGAQEHAKVLKQYGLYNDQGLQTYVQSVGAKIAKNTERPDVQYQFFLLDSPVVNAFALPGGYIYLTRGLLSLSNSEAEMAAVLAHETGHITARHSAERYSRGVVSTLGAAILSSAIGSDTVSSALGLGNDLYIKSYSRGQENQADSLGIRYLSRAGYDPTAMTSFLRNLQNDSSLEAKLAGKDSSEPVTYFSTHPATQERVAKTVSEASQYVKQGIVNRDGYLQKISGMVYGESSKDGFVRGQNFYHPDLGFQFSVPQGYRIINQPTQVIATSKADGAVIVLDMQSNAGGLSPSSYIRQEMLKDRNVTDLEAININGYPAATASFSGTVNGKPMIVRVIAIQWTKDKVIRYQIAMPRNLSAVKQTALKKATYSFKSMSRADIEKIKPYKLIVIESKAGDTVASLSKMMPFDDYVEDRFRVLNGLGPREQVAPNRLYKVVVQ